jgi:N-acetyltransferase 10
MGYGSRAIEVLNSFYSGELYNYDDAPAGMGESFADAARVGPVSLRSLIWYHR